MRKAIWLVLLTVLTWQTVFASDKLISRVDIDCLMVGSVPEAEYKNAASVSPKVQQQRVLSIQGCPFL